MARTVMVVEDDEDIREVLVDVLEEDGYAVVAASTGEEALVLVHENVLDVVLVDLRLPGIQGLDVVRSLRGSSNVPILIVTAQTDSHDVVAGLEAGADDYVTKPFVPKELCARIRALLRRSSVTDHQEEAIGWGDLELRPKTAEVMRGDQPVMLSRTEFLVLQELMLARGRVVSRSDLLRRVWGYSSTGDGRVVDNLIYRLRAKLEDDAVEPERLVTVRGFGYRLKQ